MNLTTEKNSQANLKNFGAPASPYGAVGR